MARVEFYKTGLSNLKNCSIKAGWLDTDAHPGYPGHPNEEGLTVAEIAKINNDTDRNFMDFFVANYMVESRVAKAFLVQDLQMGIAKKVFDGQRLAAYMVESIIDSIKLVPWSPNSPEWLSFKATHGYSLSPLIASQVMLDDVRSRVDVL